METSPYTDEELYQQRVGSRLTVSKLLGMSILGWTGYGLELWLQRELADLNAIDTQVEDNQAAQLRIDT